MKKNLLTNLELWLNFASAGERLTTTLKEFTLDKQSDLTIDDEPVTVKTYTIVVGNVDSKQAVTILKQRESTNIPETSVKVLSAISDSNGDTTTIVVEVVNLLDLDTFGYSFEICIPEIR